MENGGIALAWVEALEEVVSESIPLIDLELQVSAVE